MYPWVQYTTNDVIMEYLHPYINYGVIAVIDVSFACFFLQRVTVNSKMNVKMIGYLEK